MRPYAFQIEDVNKALGQTSFLNANDMGLGKTAEALWEVAVAFKRRREPLRLNDILVVTPKSAISVWHRHISEICPWLAQYFTITHWQGLLEKVREGCIDCGGTGELTLWGDTPSVCYGCHGRGYKLVSQAREEYTSKLWWYVIADEAHKAKNRKALQTQALKHIKAVHKRAYTGTPVINRPDELWSILNWLYPHDYTSYWRFFNKYVEYIRHTAGTCQACGDWHTRDYRQLLGSKNEQDLMTRIAPFYVRRYPKRDYLPWLPDEPQVVKETVELSQKQRRIYNEMVVDSLAWIGEHEDEPMAATLAIARLTRLRQFTTGYMEQRGPGVFKLTEPSTKLDAMMERISDTEEPIVVFSQFTQLINLATERLKKAGIPYYVLTGDTPDSRKDKDWRDFQDGQRRVFIANIKSGGVGIDLTRSHIVIFLDRSWSPADNKQAIDRLDRNGQTTQVEVIYIEAEDTVDQEVEEKLVWKWEIIKKMLGG